MNVYFHISNLQAEWLMKNNFAGAMVWAIDLDDFTGTFCNQGKYPLISTLKNTLGIQASGKFQLYIYKHYLNSYSEVLIRGSVQLPAGFFGIYSMNLINLKLELITNSFQPIIVTKNSC